MLETRGQGQYYNLDHWVKNHIKVGSDGGKCIQAVDHGHRSNKMWVHNTVTFWCYIVSVLLLYGYFSGEWDE